MIDEKDIPVEIVARQVRIKADRFVMELDGLKVVKLELDGHPITQLANLRLFVDWEFGAMPQICSSVPRFGLERFLMECKGPAVGKSPEELRHP